MLPIAETAITLAHEIAHNFGIYHDFENHEDKEAIKRTQKCGPSKWKSGEDNLIMNFGRPRKAEWSDCSSEDFSNNFIRVAQHKSFCLKEDQTCDGVKCFNGGHCRPSGLQPICVCTSGWSGEWCEQKLDPGSTSMQILSSILAFALVFLFILALLFHLYLLAVEITCYLHRNNRTSPADTGGPV